MFKYGYLDGEQGEEPREWKQGDDSDDKPDTDKSSTDESLSDTTEHDEDEHGNEFKKKKRVTSSQKRFDIKPKKPKIHEVYGLKQTPHGGYVQMSSGERYEFHKPIAKPLETTRAYNRRQLQAALKVKPKQIRKEDRHEILDKNSDEEAGMNSDSSDFEPRVPIPRKKEKDHGYGCGNCDSIIDRGLYCQTCRISLKSKSDKAKRLANKPMKKCKYCGVEQHHKVCRTVNPQTGKKDCQRRDSRERNAKCVNKKTAK